MGLRTALKKKLAHSSERRDSDTAQDESTMDKESNGTPERSPKRLSAASSSGSSSPPAETPVISLSDESLAEPVITGKRKPSDTPRPSNVTTKKPRQNSDVTGKRKPKDTAALVTSRPRASSYHTPTRKGEGEPSPADYLYFGPKDEKGAPLSNGGGSAAAGDATNRNRPRHTQSSSGGSHAAQPSRTDDSGFLNTGMAGARQQMGYQNLTYGGSLQYNYSGTQAPY
ncbi:hypothetical protein PG993_001401 [Apiospora rasikravindrae]|uniref:Uncharacterized protein n=1 Tax=Apiospora rasikravindrae TaxID=990691 RepID=A0ABR1UBA1_9PEZI